MITKVIARYVIGFEVDDHVIYEDGEVVYERDSILFVGHGYPQPVDTTIDVGDAIVSPGFVDLDALGDIDHALLDARALPSIQRGLEWSEEYFWGGRHEVFSREQEALKREYAYTQLILNGVTTAMPIGGEYHKEWAETYDEVADAADIAARLGLRMYLGPSYRSGVTVTRSDGSSGVAWDEEKGREGFRRAVEFVEAFDGAHQGLIRGGLLPCRIQTCTVELLRRTKEESDRLGCPVRLHACQEPDEIQLLRKWHNRTPLQLLNEIGFLGERTLIPHAVYVGGHHASVQSAQDEVELLRDSGTSVVHCPLVEARYGLALSSFGQYRRAGVQVAMGTDTFPPDMIRGMDYGSSIGRLMDGDSSFSEPADFFRAATLGGAAALGRKDLGRLCPGAKADMIVVDLSSIRTGTVEDPVRTMVFNTTGRDVRTVIINGRIVMQDRKIPGLDLDDLRLRGQAYFEKLKRAYPERDYLHRPIESLFPPSFPLIQKGND
jgi:5-methylthioadenosine/S-adenosylhomocysteine deaminase